jgi:hypothetical protein
MREAGGKGGMERIRHDHFGFLRITVISALAEEAGRGPEWIQIESTVGVILSNTRLPHLPGN